MHQRLDQMKEITTTNPSTKLPLSMRIKENIETVSFLVQGEL